MNKIDLLLGDAKTFDKSVSRGLAEGGDLTIVTKDNATQKGNPAACITFTVRTRDGRIDRAQAVVTVRNLLDALHSLMGRYSHLANATPHDGKPGERLSGHHRGIGFDAASMKEVWLISIEEFNGIAIGKSRDEAQAVARTLIDKFLDSNDAAKG